MSVLVDTSVLIDHLRGKAEALDVMAAVRSVGAVHASELTRFEVLSGMRPEEESRTRQLLGTLTWHDVDASVAAAAAQLARTWRRSHRAIDPVDYVIAATASDLGARLLTLNVRHFPMFPDLRPPY